MERAIDRLKAQDGKLYKRAEADGIVAAIAEFRSSTGLVTPEVPVPTQEDMDRLMDWLENGPEYEPMSKTELAGLFASIENLPDDNAGDEPPAE